MFAQVCISLSVFFIFRFNHLEWVILFTAFTLSLAYFLSLDFYVSPCMYSTSWFMINSQIKAVFMVKCSAPFSVCLRLYIILLVDVWKVICILTILTGEGEKLFMLKIFFALNIYPNRQFSVVNHVFFILMGLRLKIIASTLTTLHV